MYCEYRLEILKLVLEQKGEIQIKNDQSYVKTVKGVSFTENYNELEGEDDGWNDYVNKVQESTGAGHWVYTEWVHDEDFNMLGVLTFYNEDGTNIKTKHYEYWPTFLEMLRHEVRLSN